MPNRMMEVSGSWNETEVAEVAKLVIGSFRTLNPTQHTALCRIQHQCQTWDRHCRLAKAQIDMDHLDFVFIPDIYNDDEFTTFIFLKHRNLGPAAKIFREGSTNLLRGSDAWLFGIVKPVYYNQLNQKHFVGDYGPYKDQWTAIKTASDFLTEGL